jgi:hypothetical protein
VYLYVLAEQHITQNQTHFLIAFGCMYPGCEQRFTVRSNAKRHLKTHGIDPSTIKSQPTPFIVNFDNPIVHSVGTRLRNPKRIKWIPSSILPYNNARKLHSDSLSASEGEYEEDDGAIIEASGPLPQVFSPSNDASEARDNASEEDGSGGHPYHPI